SHDSSNSDERTTYIVPATLSTSIGAPNQDLASATDSATGWDTSSVTNTVTNYGWGLPNHFAWHQDYASQTFTLVSTVAPAVTSTNRWVLGPDTHLNADGFTAVDSGTSHIGGGQGTETHWFSMYTADHRPTTLPTLTQDAIDLTDTQSASQTHG